jgi:heme-degrading monooxygenase HmoA
MITRLWRGLAETRHADRYVEHLRTETLPELAKLPGFVSASVLRRELRDGTEFLVLTRWETLEAVGRFAGPDLEAAVVPETVQRLMVEYDRRARHYDIVI